MLILVIGTNTLDINKAVEVLAGLEKDKEIINFKDVIEKLKALDELPDINDSVILLDYSDILAIKSGTKESKLMTYMVVQSRQRGNTWIAKALDWKKVEGAPNIDKRIYKSHDILVTAGVEKMVLWDRRTNRKKVVTYEHDFK